MYLSVLAVKHKKTTAVTFNFLSGKMFKNFLDDMTINEALGFERLEVDSRNWEVLEDVKAWMESY